MKDYSNLKEEIQEKKDKKGVILKFIYLSMAAILFLFFISLMLYSYIEVSNKFARLKFIVISGNHILPKKNISNIIINSGNTELSTYNLSKIYYKIISNPWIKKARIAKIFPDTIYLIINEKKPAAFVYYNKDIYVIDSDGDKIDIYKKYLNMPISLPKIKTKSDILNNKSLLKSILTIYEKLDKIGKINYIDVVSGGYQVVNFSNGLNIVVNSLNCPKVALRRLSQKWAYLNTLKSKLDSVSICFDNKFVLKWKKGVGK